MCNIQSMLGMLIKLWLFACVCCIYTCVLYTTSLSYNTSPSFNSPNFWLNILSNVTSPTFVRCLCITLLTLKQTNKQTYQIISKSVQHSNDNLFCTATIRLIGIMYVGPSSLSWSPIDARYPRADKIRIFT